MTRSFTALWNFDILTYSLTYFWKTLTLTFEPEELEFSYSTCAFHIVIDCTIILDLVTLTLKLDLLENWDDSALTSNWLRNFRLLLCNLWRDFKEPWWKARSHRLLPSLCFSGLSENQNARPCLWLAETFSTSTLKPLNRIPWNLTGSKISTSSTKFVFFSSIGKPRWPPWPLIGWDIFWLETAERNSKKLERNEARCQHPLPSLCFLGWSENQDGRLASDWLRRFWLLIWNAEQNPTKFDRKEARSQQPLQSLCTSGPSEKQDGHPFRSINKGGTLYSGSWYVALWAPCSRNLTGSKILMSFSTSLPLNVIQQTWQKAGCQFPLPK